MSVSMLELRVMSVIGLLATAVTVTLLTIFFTRGVAALGGVIWHALGRNRATVHGTTAYASSSLGPKSR